MWRVYAGQAVQSRVQRPLCHQSESQHNIYRLLLGSFVSRVCMSRRADNYAQLQADPVSLNPLLSLHSHALCLECL